MADYWIKLYMEILDDPKMATLPDRLWRRAIELFLLAGRNGVNKNGTLPDTRQLAWILRMSTDDLAQDLDQLISTGIIEPIPNGWRVVNFAKRQAAVSSAERQKNYRERLHREQYADDVTDSVTNQLRNVTQRTDNRVQSTETDNREEKSGDAFNFIHTTIKTITGIPAAGKAGVEAIQALADMKATPADIEAGFKWLTDNGVEFKYYNQLVGPTRTAMNKRTSKQAGRRKAIKVDPNGNTLEVNE